MATKNIVPRADGEGGIGTNAKKWGVGYFTTPTAGDNSNKVATTAYVQAELADYVTTNDLSADLEDYAPLASPQFTGNPQSQTTSVGDDSTSIATTAYVKDCVPKSVGNSTTPVYTNDNGVITAGSEYVAKSVLGSTSSTSISSNKNLRVTTATTLNSISLAAGSWIVTGHVHYVSPTANRIYGAELHAEGNAFYYNRDGNLTLHTAMAAALSIQTVRIFTSNSSFTVYLNGYSSVAATADTATITAVRFK